MVRSSRSIHSSVVNWLRHCAVLVQVEGGDLDRLQALDPERAFLALLLLVVLVLDVHLRPDAAHQQPVVVPQVVLGTWTNLWPKLTSSAQCLSSSAR